MNILYILGNGFDKAMGMATSYPEFYKYLKENVKNGSSLFNKMMSQITSDTALWSDMELALGNFTDSTNDSEEFDDFYFELNEYLQQYLKIENDKFQPTKELKTLLHGHNFSVMSLNYTNTFEKVFGMKYSNDYQHLTGNIYLQEVIHVHGTLGKSVIVGVDNEEQIKNTDFRDNNDIKDCMIKKQSNYSMKQTRHLYCQNLIDKADLIILFGVSLGETDVA